MRPPKHRPNTMNTRQNDKIHLLIFALGLLVLFCYRVWVLTQPYQALFYDEIQYYHWSLSPDFGYYSKPPMVAWFIGLSTGIFGDSSFGIKISGTIAWTTTAIVLFIIGKTVWNTRAGVATSLLFITSPLAGAYSLYTTTDASLLLFWSLSLWLFILAQRDQKTWQWALAGVFTGLGLLSKYTMILLPFAYFIYLLLSPTRRVQFITFKPWLAGIIALGIFSSNVIWNIQNEFISIQHTSEISQLSGSLFNFENLALFLITQIFIFGILSSIFLFIKSKTVIQAAKQDKTLLLIALSGLSILGVISLQALLARAFGNWAAPVLIAASLLAGFALQNKNRWVATSVVFNLLFLSIFYHYPLLQKSLGIEPTQNNTPYVRTYNWEETLKPIGELIDIENNPEALLITSDSRKLLVYSGYYFQRGNNVLAYWNPSETDIRNYYDQEFNLRNWAGKDEQRFLYIAENPLSPSELERFAQSELIYHKEKYHPSAPKKTLYAYQLKGFQGYE